MSAGQVSVSVTAPHDNAVKTLKLQRVAAERSAADLFTSKTVTSKNVLLVKTGKKIQPK